MTPLMKAFCLGFLSCFDSSSSYDRQDSDADKSKIRTKPSTTAAIVVPHFPTKSQPSRL
ncbi:hypothetical protein CDL12_30050 [Handroanthus impetiginosus]|uniref:Uncharacterized protein n=1 Tax=Handroanthus impetiginosus TaxID=429701 RepID=A0A2G9FXS2_9LAMI|nr:hypothetical protein CDL12_30050 [Handroanthus impetiginosus]